MTTEQDLASAPQDGADFVQPADRVRTVFRALEHAGLQATLSPGERLQRGRDNTYLPPEPADIVAFAKCTADVSAIARICHAHDMPLLAFGAGTSNEGHVMARAGGVCVDLTAMDKIIDISPLDFHCTVQAGVVRKTLNEYLRDTGLWFTIDACAEATIGGMISTRASGTNALRYGTMRENVITLEVVLADGEIVRTGGTARKCAAGYDLTRLFTGAAGTLGIITEATVRLHPIPENAISASCCFSGITDAARAVADLVGAGHEIGKVELLDADLVGMMNRYSGTTLRERPTLIFDFTGPRASVEEAAKAARAICNANNGEDFTQAVDADERNKLWQARHEAGYAAIASRPRGTAWATDMTVPVSRLAEAIETAQQELAALPFPTPILGHAGDGNYHVIYVLDPENPEELTRATEVNDRLVRNAIAMGGTCSGEHGVGYSKNKWLEEEFGSGTMRVMKAIKDALDPKGLLNPGKIFDL